MTTDLDRLVDWTFREIRESLALDPITSLEETRMEVLQQAFMLCSTCELYDFAEYAKRILIRDKNLYYTIIDCMKDYPQFEYARANIVKLATLL